MNQAREIVGIQFLRGFAAVAVVIAHASQMVGLPKYFESEPLGGWLRAGVGGVDLFFVISGFIIAIVSLHGPELAPRVSRRTFLLRRAARILPLMWLAVAAFVLLRVVGTPDRLASLSYVRAALLLPFGDVQPAHLWTLRQELIFYLLFALSFLGSRRWRWVLAGWVAASLVVSATVGRIDSWTVDRILLGTPAIEFGFGLVAGLAWVRRPWDAETRIGVHPLIVLALLTTLALAVGHLVGGPVISAVILGGCATALVILATQLACPQDALTRLGKLLGDASYAIYLFHIHLLALLLVGAVRLVPGAAPALVMGGVALLAIAGGIVMHRVVERPLVRWAQRTLLGGSGGAGARLRDLPESA